MRSRSSSAATPTPATSAPRAGVIALTWSDGAALLAVLAWGLGFPVQKLLMTVASPLTVTFLRVAITVLVYAGILLCTGQWQLPRRRDMGRFVAVGLIGMTLNGALYAYGLHLTTASHSGLIYTLTPLFVFGLSHLLGQLRIDRLDLVGLALGLAGAVLIVGAPSVSGGESGGATLLGDLLTVGAVMTFGLWALLAAPLLRVYGTLRATAWIAVAGAAGLLPLCLPDLLAQDWRSLSWMAVGGFAYSGLIVGALGTLLWYSAVKRIGAARTMVYANLESLFAVVAAALMLAERVEWTALVGGLAVIGGVLLTRRGTGDSNAS